VFFRPLALVSQALAALCAGFHDGGEEVCYLLEKDGEGRGERVAGSER